MIFIDLETTGATATVDRITEIGIVDVTEHGVERFSQLLDPQAKIPEFIQRLTGITQDMVEGQPTFAHIASSLHQRLQGRLFVAHNARFDYGFIKNEFKRVGIQFRAPVLCTVKLSRELYPHESRHNLDTLIERHGLVPSGRHRALADADLIYQFWEKLQQSVDPDQLEQAVTKLSARPALPSGLDPELPDQLPEGPGVYIFYGENDFPLYVGKSIQLRKRVLSHFSSDHQRGKELSLSMQVRRVEWIETAGEFQALLKESELVKALVPSHNTRLRRNKELCAWRIAPVARHKSLEDLRPELVWARDLHFGAQPDLYGTFKSQRDATAMLSELAKAERLCKAALGLEKAPSGRPCFGFQLGHCAGACVGQETAERHHLRLLTAMARHKLPHWPYPSAVGLKEGRVLHVADAWCYLGAAENEAQALELLESGRPSFDLDLYKILRKAIRVLPIVQLPASRSHAEPL